MSPLGKEELPHEEDNEDLGLAQPGIPGNSADHDLRLGTSVNKPEESGSIKLPKTVQSDGAFQNRLGATLVAAPDEVEGNQSAPEQPIAIPEATERRRGWRRRKKETPAKVSYKDRIAASTIRGRFVIPLRVMPLDNTGKAQPSYSKGGTDTQYFSTPRLLDIENGDSVLVTNQKNLGDHRFEELNGDETMVVAAKIPLDVERDDQANSKGKSATFQEMMSDGDFREFHATSELGLVGGAWRGIFRRFMMRALDETNRLRLSHQLQTFVPFLTGHESYLLWQVIECLDDPSEANLQSILKLAPRNRSVSRILVGTVCKRWDFSWHWHHQVSSSGLYDFFGRLPIVGVTKFPQTENFPAASARVLAVEGLRGTRVNQSGTWSKLPVNDREKFSVQNLSTEINGFEAVNRFQLGNYFGRQKVNLLRLESRFPTDGSIVRAFVSQPLSTMINNGAVHTLEQVSQHWNKTLANSDGNLTQSRLEQLDPFETMRVHMPVVCLVLASLRGRNNWDSQVLGPFMRQCQELKYGVSADGCRYLVSEMQERIVWDLCAGIKSIIDPLQRWLVAIGLACDTIEEEARVIYTEVAAVEVGLRLGNDLVAQVSWKLPTNDELDEAILLHVRGKKPGVVVNERRIRAALQATTSRDKRTLTELTKSGFEDSVPVQLLLARVRTLLQREMRREALDAAIRELSMGDYTSEFIQNEWYWIEEGRKQGVYIYDQCVEEDKHRFLELDSGYEKIIYVAEGNAKFRCYVPVAEAINRAQRCFMNIELEHLTKFKYCAFMEFSFLRSVLRQLEAISQLFCEELDNSRLRVLEEIQRYDQSYVEEEDMIIGRTYYEYNEESKTYDEFVHKRKHSARANGRRIASTPPQSVVVVGGGLSGLMTTLHCTESVLRTGGQINLLEATDSVVFGASAFESAQIVRLDARWTSMLRYHLGTNFENVFIPASGGTDAQFGNALPAEGFVETTVKELKNLLHLEVTKMWSKGVVQCSTNAKARYDAETNALIKNGEHLRIKDCILLPMDAEGQASQELYSWHVVDLVFLPPLALTDLRIGREYGVYIRSKEQILPFKLAGVDLRSRTYTFQALEKGTKDVKGTAHNLPPVYPKGTNRNAEPNKIVVECDRHVSGDKPYRHVFSIEEARGTKFKLNTNNSHIVECMGSPNNSTAGLQVTNQEPYGMCCIQGLKVSMCMHNFGEKSRGSGLLDDLSSRGDQSTRGTGDCMKTVKHQRIAEEMLQLVKSSNWKKHFTALAKSHIKTDNEWDTDSFLLKLRRAVLWLAVNSSKFKKHNLQTVFLETGDNLYVGAEFSCEYEQWKKETAEALAVDLRENLTGNDPAILDPKDTLMHHIDRMWFQAYLQVARAADVYSMGSSRRIPEISTINSYTEQELQNLALGETFRLASRPGQRYEILLRKKEEVISRNTEGNISKLKKDTVVFREGNLTRAQDGKNESEVAVSSFPISYNVNSRAAKRNHDSKGYMFAFVGDEPTTSHFMQYGALSGTSANVMLLNRFLQQGATGVSFEDRLIHYKQAIDWSNSEVVSRGTGSLFGRDGFLRPCFSYRDGISYLREKALESLETNQNIEGFLSPVWKAKFGASMIPRGMELNEDFIRAFYAQIRAVCQEVFLEGIRCDKEIKDPSGACGLLQQLVRGDNDFGTNSYWDSVGEALSGVDDAVVTRIQNHHVNVASAVEQAIVQIVEHATKGHLYNERVLSGANAQPKPVDSIVGHYAVEAQSIANTLGIAAVFSAGALAFVLFDLASVPSDIGRIFGSILGGLNILVSFGVLTAAVRYKTRNEEARAQFFTEKLAKVQNAAFATMSKDAQRKTPKDRNPFLAELRSIAEAFRSHAANYKAKDPDQSGFDEAYLELTQSVLDVPSIRKFQKALSTVYIPDVYHENSHVQECLVDLYKTCEELVALLEAKNDNGRYDSSAEALFQRLNQFGPKLERSLHPGSLSYGFGVLRFLCSLVCCATISHRNAAAPLQTETLGIWKQMRELSACHKNAILTQEVRDVRSLYMATRESDLASLIFMSALMVHVVSWIFSICRIIILADGPSRVMEVAAWASLASMISVIVAALHFQGKVLTLMRLRFNIGRKISQTEAGEAQDALRKVAGAASWELLVALLRMISAYGAAIVLPWSVVVFEFPTDVSTDPEVIVWIAIGAVGAAIVAVVLSQLLEFMVGYHQSPCMGVYVGDAYRKELEALYDQLKSTPWNKNEMDSKDEQARKTWEYVARDFLHQHRFDMVFGADRFGPILQYIQSGLR